ncbi:ABC transporter ATP-binding protein [Paeniglutamicibacter cryotolerans]|uniref:Peptide/nickel transport system ATP-binding protein n=1 Tax=Paeniglutamicibacter cryotolerans TaxID=670079 RepID=A0A839QN43_9MICC|nr:ABC transporter ATP-binding protein [Paeniglutamicibacter cryotolerans]MBB2997013.1 peptide/nickel transport system ATP-binding protein [Paeniglutamicibacter cryotolerans]
MPLLEIRDLSTDIRLSKSVVHALDHVTMHVDSGECLGLVGESGSGKTMTAMSIERLLPPGGQITNGQIIFDGEDLVQLGEPRLREIRGGDIGMIFQDPMTSLNPVQTIGEQVAEPLMLHRNMGKAAALKEVVEMFGLVGIPSPAERIKQFPHQLSGGQRQRVMIAMALICQPKLLIADEPTTALDVTVQKQILELVSRLRVELNMAMILVTHDLGVIAGNADRVVVMYAGKIAEMADVHTLFLAPKHRYTDALFEALPERAAGTGERLYSIPGLPPDLTEPPPACRFAPRCRFAVDLCRTMVPPVTTFQTAAGPQEYACFVPRTTPLAVPEQVDLRTVVPELARVEAAELEAGTDLSDAVQGTGPDKGQQPAAQGAAEADLGSWVAPRTFIPADGTPLLQIQSVVKDFPVTAGAILRRHVGDVSAVADVTLAIPRGSTLGLVGESGCGKTTLGRLVVGLEEPTDGHILFRGRKISKLRGKEAKEGRRNVQFMFQDSYASLDPRMRVRQILREPLDIQHVGTPSDRNERVDELLAAVGLPARAAERYPHEFSGGQRQRIGLARALALQPGLIVADEPVSALDVSIQAQVLNLMKDLQRDRELTYLFISHDLSVVRYLSDVIAVMYLGRMVEVGPAAEVYSRPQHHYTRGLIDTIPIPDPIVERQKAKLGVRGELPSAINPPSGCRFRTRCPMAQDICARVVPLLQPGGGSEPISAQAVADATDLAAARGTVPHLTACHFPIDGYAAVDVLGDTVATPGPV